MSLAADEVELLDLPAEVAGLPYEVRRDAFAWAESALPLAEIITRLGQAEAEQALVQATAHWLLHTRNPTAEPDTPHSPRRGAQMDRPGNNGDWAGTPYGDAVARILDRLPGGSRRCGGIAVIT